MNWNDAEESCGAESYLSSVFCSLCLSSVVQWDAGLLLPLPPAPPEQHGQQEEQQEAQRPPDESRRQRQTPVPWLEHRTGPLTVPSIVHRHHTNLWDVLDVAHSTFPSTLPKSLPLSPPDCHIKSCDVGIRCTPLNYDLWPIPGDRCQGGGLRVHIM